MKKLSGFRKARHSQLLTELNGGTLEGASLVNFDGNGWRDITGREPHLDLVLSSGITAP
jgi:hypothetical protein